MSRVSRGFRVAGFVIKLLFSMLVAFVCGFLLWRIFSSSDPSSMKNIWVNDSIYEAYYESDGELYMFTQEQNSTTRADYNAGYFSITQAVFIPEANQIQVVLRYNNSTIKALAKDYELTEIPNREDDLFDISLFLSIDKTPENIEDNATISDTGTKTIRCSSKQVLSDQKNLYNYRRFVFDLDECGVDIDALIGDGTLLAVYADIYYAEDMDIDERAYGTLCLYDYITENKEVKLTSAMRKEIEAYKPED